jgi:hypothetical protein
MCPVLRKHRSGRVLRCALSERGEGQCQQSQRNRGLIDDITAAWEEVASGAQFGGMTLAQFKTKVKPSLDYRAEVATLDNQLTIARKNRNNADDTSNDVCLAVVNGVRSHPDYGENSALYKAMGYVPKNERKSGLVRPSDAARPAIQVAA